MIFFILAKSNAIFDIKNETMDLIKSEEVNLFVNVHNH